MPAAPSSLAEPASVLALLARAAAFLGLWLVLTGGELNSLIYAAPVLLAATAISASLYPPRRSRPRFLALLLFAAGFLRLALMGGIDAALRALRPRMPIDPDLLFYRHRPSDDPIGIGLAYAISLQPGSLVARFEADGFRVHAIDRAAPVEAAIAATERRLVAALGLPKVRNDG